MNKTYFPILGLAIGIGLGFTDLIAPLHEAAHVAVAASHGVNAQITGWTSTKLSEFNSQAMFAGWSTNLYIGVLISLILAFVGRHSRFQFLTGAGGLGFALANFYRAYGSWDFNGAVQQYVNSLIEGPVQRFYAYQEIHQSIMIRWSILGGALILISCVVVALRYRSYRRRVA